MSRKTTRVADDRDRDLRHMKRLAGGLLALMAAVYVVTLRWRTVGLPMGLVNSFAEAAMVGALADWFAVVALFRHPLGIPFWHTAVLPRNRDRIGKSLAQFVVTHFLTRDALAERLAATDISVRIGAALKAQAPSLAHRVVRLLPELSHVAADADVQRLVREHLLGRLQALRLAPVAGKALGVVLAADRHHAITDAILNILGGILEDGPPLAARAATAGPASRDWRLFRWMRRIVSEKLAGRLRRGLAQMVEEARSTPEHHLREAVERRIADFVGALQTSPEYCLEGERLKDALLADPRLREWLDAAWLGLRGWVADDMRSTDSKMLAALTALLATAGDVLAEDDAIRGKVNAWLRTAGVDFLSRHREEVAALIERRFQRWESGQISEVLERAVGRDLQFIRLNGTIIGGSVGVVLHLLRLLVEA